MINRELDQFFTTEEIANKCLTFLGKYFNLQNLSWIEPSAGTGVFLKQSQMFGMQKHSAAFDVMPQAQDIQKSDFLTVDLSIVFKEKSQRLCLGNPPFGKNSSLAVKFFNHAAPHSDIIAMILPATFSKESIQKKLNKNFHLKAELDLGNTPFNFIDEIRNVPVVFQIWEKSTEARHLANSKLVSQYFTFVSREDCDFAIQRVGNAAGRVKSNVINVANASHYFIKSEFPEVRMVFEKIDWSSIKRKTAGNPSIAKTELIRELEKALQLN